MQFRLNPHDYLQNIFFFHRENVCNRHSSPGGMSPSTLFLDHGDSPRYYILTSEQSKIHKKNRAGRNRELQRDKTAALPTRSRSPGWRESQQEG